MTGAQAAFVVAVFMLTFLIFITQRPNDYHPDAARSGTGGVSLGRLLRTPQFLAALLVAATYRLWQEATGIWGALTNKHQYVSDELKAQRLAVCRKCPLYYRPLGTCGSPLRKDATEGCHCYMEAAAGAYHDCWAREEHFEGIGWPNELNSTWIDDHATSTPTD